MQQTLNNEGGQLIQNTSYLDQQQQQNVDEALCEELAQIYPDVTPALIRDLVEQCKGDTLQIIDILDTTEPSKDDIPIQLQGDIQCIPDTYTGPISSQNFKPGQHTQCQSQQQQQRPNGHHQQDIIQSGQISPQQQIHNCMQSQQANSGPQGSSGTSSPKITWGQMEHPEIDVLPQYTPPQNRKIQQNNPKQMSNNQFFFIQQESSEQQLNMFQDVAQKIDRDKTCHAGTSLTDEQSQCVSYFIQLYPLIDQEVIQCVCGSKSYNTKEIHPMLEEICDPEQSQREVPIPQSYSSATPLSRASTSTEPSQHSSVIVEKPDGVDIYAQTFPQSYDQCRQVYAQYRQEPNRLRRAHKKVWRLATYAKINGHIGVYEQKVQEADGIMKQLTLLDQLACKNILYQLNKDHPDNVLDLHGLHAQEVRQVLIDRFIKLKQKDLHEDVTYDTLKLIVGKGKHSERKEPIVPTTVCSFLNSIGASFEQREGMVIVNLSSVIIASLISDDCDHTEV